MYKLVIVDDEDSIREGLCTYITAQSLDFEVVATFEDGKEAIEYLSDHQVDVVFTDIKMSEVSGLELARYIYKHIPETKVVIITGHKEFEYAKQAIEYGVEDYLLKPTKSDEIKKTLEKIKRLRDEKYFKSQNNILEKERIIEEMRSILRQQFFSDIVMGIFRDASEIIRRIEIANIDIDPFRDACYIVDVNICDFESYTQNSWAYGKERLLVAVRNLIETDATKDKYHYCYGKNGLIKYIAVSVDSGLDELKRKIKNHMDEISKAAEGVFKLRLSYEIIEGYDNLFELSSASKSRLKDANQENFSRLINREMLSEKYKIIISYITTGDVDETNRLISDFILSISNLPIEYVHYVVLDFFVLLLENCKTINAEVFRYFDEMIDYKVVYGTKDINALIQWCRKISSEIARVFNDRQEDYAQTIISKTKAYVEANYSRDISLEDVADSVYLNAFYFSRFFKQHTGENFSDYIVKVRIQHAIELLKQRKFKIYQVGEAVGYKSSKYFARVFRQITKYSPTEYSRIVLGFKEVGE